MIRKLNIDKYLCVAILTAFIFCLHGINWGRVEIWNMDQAIYNRLEDNYKPKSFYKPPLHTYIGNIFIIEPLKIIKNKFPYIPYNFNTIELISLRLLNILFFLGSIILVYYITRSLYGLFPARVISYNFIYQCMVYRQSKSGRT